MVSTDTPLTQRSVPTWVYLTVLVLVSIVSRLPQLLSPNLLLEGDECILGLMGMHLAQGREFPVFFYGQRYGLSIVEAPAAAVSFLIFGAGAVPLKLAMLGIWTVGIAFYFLAFSRPLGKTRSFWITLLLVLMPAWAATSMKAWSGYITAFSAAAIVIHLITRNDNRRAAPWLIAGGVSGFIYFAQPLWLPGLLPIALYFLWSSRRRIFWLSYVSGMLGVMLVVTLITTFWLTDVIETWTRPPAGNPHLFASVPRLLSQTYVDLTGSFYFGTPVYTGPVTASLGYFWFAVLGILGLVQVFRVLTRRYLLWSHLLFVSVCSTLAANWILLDWRDARYAMALNAPLVFMAGVEFFDLADRYRLSMRKCAAAILVLVALESVSMNEFRNYSYMWWTNSRDTPSETKTLLKVIGYLRSRGVTRAFAMNALLQWPITFYSHETVIARWKAGIDRYPPYIKKIDRALNNGETVAIVGYAGYTYGLERMVRDPNAIITVDGKYFVYFGPDKDVLRRAGFAFR
jgi:hypothetical protein